MIALITELRKCILVCANCHREIHAGLIDSKILTTSQVIDEKVVQRYTTELQLAKQNRLMWANDRKREITAWRDKNPHTKQLSHKVDWSKHDVYQLLEEHKSYEAVGRLLGVTGAAVKRRLKHLESKK